MGDLLDSTLAGLARSGSNEAPDAFAELVDRHLDSVYDFALRVTLSEDAALEAIQAALVTAEFALGSLNPAADSAFDVRAWLLALVRPTALAAVGEADPADRAQLASIAADQLPIGLDPAEADRLAPLVWDAATLLDPQQRLLLDLASRQRLGAAAVARIVGVTEANAAVVLTRLYSTLRDQLAAHVLANDPDCLCPTVAAIADPAQKSSAESSGGDLPIRQILQHIESCEVCKPQWQAYPSLLDVYGALALVAPSDPLRERIIGEIVASWPAETGFAPLVAVANPVAARPSVTRRATRLILLLGIAAAILAAALLLPFSPISLTRGDETTGANGAATADPNPTVAVVVPLPSPTSTPTETATPTPVRTPSPSPSPSPSPTPTRTATGTSTPTLSATATPTVAATSTPVSTVLPCASPLQASAALVTVAGGATGSVSLINGAGCGSAPFVVTVANGAAWLTASPPSGSIPPGGSIALGFAVDAALVPPGEGSYSAQVAISGGPSPIAITVTTQRGGAAPVVVSASAICGGSSAAFTVIASDDVAVSSVSILYQNATGASRSIALTSSGGAWSGATSAAEVRGGSGFLAVAVDGASHTATSSLTLPSSCN